MPLFILETDMIYVNGDSYCLTNTPNSFGAVLADMFETKLLSKAMVGSSNKRILRTTTRDVMRFWSDGTKDVKVIVGLTFLFRIDMWAEGHCLHRWREFYDDGEFISVQPALNDDWYETEPQVHHHCPPDYREYVKQRLMCVPSVAELTNVLWQLSLLKNLCNHYGYQFIAFWAADTTKDIQMIQEQDLPVLKDFYNQFDETNSIDLASFSFVKHYTDLGYVGYDADKYGRSAHLTEEVHRLFANRLYAQLNNSVNT